jgi:hypothetical protein
MRHQDKPDEKVPFWEWIARGTYVFENVWQIKGFKVRARKFGSVARKGLRSLPVREDGGITIRARCPVRITDKLYPKRYHGSKWISSKV